MAKNIRQTAEEILRKRFPAVEPASTEELQAIVHELRVHQIELELQNDELRKAQERLSVTQKRYFELFNYAPVGYLTVDEQGVILDINLTGADLLGKARNKLIGRPLLPHLALTSTPIFYEHLAQLFASGSQLTTELTLKPVDGQEIAIYGYSRLAQEDGRTVCRMALVDITEQKQAELALRRSEEQFRQFAESIDQVLWIFARNPEKALFVSRAFATIWGRPVAALYKNGSVWAEAIHPHDQQRVVRAYENWIERKSMSYREQYRVVRPDGSVCWVLDTGASVVYEDNRAVRISGIVKDITAEKLAEITRKNNEELLHMALEAARMGIWSRDLVTDKLTWSDQHGPVVGLPAGAKIENRADFLAMIHPDDRVLLDEAAAAALKNNLYHCEYRIVWPDGSLRWMESRGQVYRDGHGQPQRLTGTVMDVTDKKEAEQRLKQMLAYYHTLFEDTPTSLWEEDFSAVKKVLNQLQAAGITDFETYFADNETEVYRLWAAIKVIDINQATLDLLRASDKAQILKRLAPLEGRPKTFVSFCRQLVAVATGQTHFRGEATSKTVDGSELDIIVYWSVVPGYEATYERLLVAVVDVTELKQTEAALRMERASLAARVTERTAELEQVQQQTEALYLVSRAILHFEQWPDLLKITLNTIAETLPSDQVSLYLLDVEGRRVLDFAAINIGGAQPTAMSFDELWSGVNGWVIRNSRATLLSGSQPNQRLNEAKQNFRPEDGIGPLMVAPLQYQGRALGTLTTARNSGSADFTVNELELLQVMADQIAVALTRHRLTEVLQQRTQELLQANRLKDQFLATMSHELRTPLNVIFGNVEILQEKILGPLTPKQLQSLNAISNSGQHLLQLIDDILDLSEIEMHQLELNPEPVSLETVCHNCLDSIQQLAHKKDIAVHSQIDPDVTTIVADEQRLRQILVNLLTNAVKFTPKGGQIGLEVVYHYQNDVIDFVVWDTGIGISEANLDVMFDPFVQLDGGLNRQEEGTGLGLTLVQRLTAMHGGKVTVDSTPGQGSRFTVSLPHKTSAAIGK